MNGRVLGSTPNSIVLAAFLLVGACAQRQTLPTPTQSGPATQTGTVTGKIPYPSEGVPEMTLYFQNVSSGQVLPLAVPRHQFTYTIDLPTGDYFAYAWTQPSANPAIPELAGGFTKLSREFRACDYFDLQPIQVTAGQTVMGVDIFNWLGINGAFPISPDNTPREGVLQGHITLPPQDDLATTLFARNAATGATITQALSPGSSEFEFTNLTAGWYYVYSWTQLPFGQFLSGSHSIEGTCGNLPSCERRCMTPVEVRANETTTGIEVGDWADSVIVTSLSPMWQASLASSVSLAPALSTKTFTETGIAPVYSIKVDLPVIRDVTSASAQRFNQAIADLVESELAAFRANIEWATGSSTASGSTFTLKYSTEAPLGDIVSVKFSAEGYIDGAAHTYNYSRTINYQFSTEKVLELSDIFIPNPGYLDALAAFCKTEIQRRFGDSYDVSGAEPTPENYRNWNITPDGIRVTFDPYQVTAYAAGEQTVFIPFRWFGGSPPLMATP